MSKITILCDTIRSQAESLRITCGIARCYMMSALVVNLLELLHEVSQQTSADELEGVSDVVDDSVRVATCSHSLLVTNRRPSADHIALEICHPNFFYSDLEHHESNASCLEHELYRQLCQTVSCPLLEGHFPFPLCELAISLSTQIQTEVPKLMHRLEAAQSEARFFMSDDHNPELLTYIERTIQAGMMTPSGQWEANVTRAQIAYWVDKVASRLKIGFQWKWAQCRWGIVNLAQDQHKNVMGQYIPHRALIDSIFGVA